MECKKVILAMLVFTATVMAQAQPTMDTFSGIPSALEARGFSVRTAENADARTMRETIGSFLSDEGADPDARILLWFSGNGHNVGGRGFLVPADAPPLGLAELAGEPWVAGCPRCRSHLVGRAARAGFVPDVRHSTDDYVVVQALVASGLAVALLPALALAAHRHPDVACLPVDLPPRRIGVLTRPATHAAPAVVAAVRHLRRAGAHPARIT